MTTPLISLLAVMAATLFDVRQVPATPNCAVFLADADADAVADILVQERRTLMIYRSDGAGPLQITFAPGTAAYDFADLDADDHPELVAICGQRVIRYRLAADAKEPDTLFSINTLYAEHKALPFPSVIVIEIAGQPLLALPCKDALELRTPAGARMASYPTGPDAPHKISIGRPLYAGASDWLRMEDASAYEIFVRQWIRNRPELPKALQADGESVSSKGGSYGPHKGDWQWFALSTAGEVRARVLYTWDLKRFDTTLIKISRAKAGLDAFVEEESTPARNYPGRLLMTQLTDLPDFNGDGYTDLLMLDIPEPGMSVDALTRAIAGGKWPLSLSVHLYMPQAGRYEPKPAARTEIRVPIGWLMPQQGDPLHIVVRDFNGDGGSDLACAISETLYAAWLFTDSGFSKEPDFTVSLDEPLRDIAFCEDLGGTGRTTLGLVTGASLYILRP